MTTGWQKIETGKRERCEMCECRIVGPFWAYFEQLADSHEISTRTHTACCNCAGDT
jgi:hypothetical protein